MSEYDGTWENDPLDLRGIRLDAELDQIYSGHEESDEYELIQTLQDLYVCRAEDPKRFEIIGTKWATETKHTFGQKFQPCVILNKKNEIVEYDCHNPRVALQKVLELSIRNNNHMKDYQILRLSTLKMIPLEEAHDYE